MKITMRYNKRLDGTHNYMFYGDGDFIGSYESGYWVYAFSYVNMRLTRYDLQQILDLIDTI